MEHAGILALLNESYELQFSRIELIRDSGSEAYAAYTDGGRYFLRTVKPAFFDTAAPALDIQLFLQQQGFPVPPVLYTRDGSPCVWAEGEKGKRLCILYAFLQGEEADPEQDAAQLGALVGQLHQLMQGYPRPLVKRDKHFYIGRYLDILQKKAYPAVEQFALLGESLWKRLKNLPRGYCHGDLYRGNFLKTPEGKIYLLDFDTSCCGFPMYDLALACNLSDYFQLQEDGCRRSRAVLRQFLPEYRKFYSLDKAQEDAFEDMISLYHFALQATIIEVFGMDCVDHAFFDRQLHWLRLWQEQCAEG